MGSKEQLLWSSIADGHVDLAESLIRDKSVDVNWFDDEDYRTPLFRACGFGHVKLVELLLRHPDIDLSLIHRVGATHLCAACQSGHTEVVAVLLNDPRVATAKPNFDNCTPLWFAAQNGHLTTVQLLLASGKELGMELRSNPGDLGWNGKTAAEIGKHQLKRFRGHVDRESQEDYDRSRKYGPVIGDLLDEHQANPALVTDRLRRTKEIREYFISEFFGLVIFLADNFVRFKPCLTPSDASSKEQLSRARRFLEIATQLPLDLQMVLCNRAFGSPQDVVLTRFSEMVFRKLAREAIWKLTS